MKLNTLKVVFMCDTHVRNKRENSGINFRMLSFQKEKYFYTALNKASFGDQKEVKKLNAH